MFTAQKPLCLWKGFSVSSPLVLLIAVVSGLVGNWLGSRTLRVLQSLCLCPASLLEPSLMLAHHRCRATMLVPPWAYSIHRELSLFSPWSING